jgi:hypothetical protein
MEGSDSLRKGPPMLRGYPRPEQLSSIHPNLFERNEHYEKDGQYPNIKKARSQYLLELFTGPTCNISPS